MRLTLLLCLMLGCGAWPCAAQRLEYVPLGVEEADLAAGRDQPAKASGPRLQYVLLDRLEWAPQRGPDGYAWDVSALWGGRNGLWLSSVGDGGLWAAPDYLEFQALYSRDLENGLYLNAGLRWDAAPAPQRVYLAAGGQWEADWADAHDLWLGAFTYLSHKGEVSGRLGGIYNHRLANRLYAQPSFELNLSAADVPELGLGRGLSYAEAGLRLRYEVANGFAPYLGFSWERSLGRTARLARDAGEDVESKSVVVGVRSLWESN